MPSDKKHVLLRDDLAPGFDEAAALKAMEAMTDEVGKSDWQGHIPYSAAIGYLNDVELVGQYESHVDGCDYCRRLIDALNPSEKLVDDLRDLLRKFQVGRRFEDWLNMEPTGEVYAGFLANPGCLKEFEAQEDIMAKFKAARIYLGTTQPRLAYKLIGEGCKLAKIHEDVIATLVQVAEPHEDLADSLVKSVEILRRPMEPEWSAEMGQQLQKFEAFAELGWHRMAMTSLHGMLSETPGTGRVVEAMTRAELVESKIGGGEQSTPEEHIRMAGLG